MGFIENAQADERFEYGDGELPNTCVSDDSIETEIHVIKYRFVRQRKKRKNKLQSER